MHIIEVRGTSLGEIMRKRHKYDLVFVCFRREIRQGVGDVGGTKEMFGYRLFTRPQKPKTRTGCFAQIAYLVDKVCYLSKFFILHNLSVVSPEQNPNFFPKPTSGCRESNPGFTHPKRT